MKKTEDRQFPYNFVWQKAKWQLAFSILGPISSWTTHDRNKLISPTCSLGKIGQHDIRYYIVHALEQNDICT